LAESKGWFRNSQTGFRKQRSCEDQVIRLCQAVSDGFQQRPPLRTTTALLDYSRAYDRVWQKDLIIIIIIIIIITLYQSNFPLLFIRWIAGFLRKRQACVQFNGERSRTSSLGAGRSVHISAGGHHAGRANSVLRSALACASSTTTVTAAAAAKDAAR